MLCLESKEEEGLISMDGATSKGEGEGGEKLVVAVVKQEKEENDESRAAETKEGGEARLLPAKSSMTETSLTVQSNTTSKMPVTSTAATSNSNNGSSSSSGVSDLDEEDNDGSSEVKKIREEEAEDSATSDYPRSTPSPRDVDSTNSAPDLTRKHSLSGDLGLGEEIKEELVQDDAEQDEDSQHRHRHFSFSPSTFYAKRSIPFPKVKRRRLEIVDHVEIKAEELEEHENEEVVEEQEEEEPSCPVRILQSDHPQLLALDASCKSSILAAAAAPGMRLKDRLTLIRDCRIMRSSPRVELRPTPTRELLAADPKSVLDNDVASKDLLAGVSVSPKRRKKSAPKLDWFASAKQQVIISSTSQIQRVGSALIRPAVLQFSDLKAPQPPVGDVKRAFSSSPEASPKISSSDEASKSSSSFKPPPLKSSYLFGFADDFECVPEGDLLIVSEEDEEEEFEEEFKEEVAEESKESQESVSDKPEVEDAVMKTDVVVEDSKDCDDIIGIIPRKSTDATPSSTKLRFPAVQGPQNMIECKWQGCQMRFKSYGKLSDHLKASHIIGQVNREMARQNPASTSSPSAVPSSSKGGKTEVTYRCLWDGCKVFGKRSCSRSWLEKHVPTHGGRFAFACIVSGCKMRFSSQKILQRHVDSHFSSDEERSNGKKGRKRDSASSSAAVRNRKSNGTARKSGGNLAQQHNPWWHCAREAQFGVLYGCPRKSVALSKASESSRQLKRAGVRLRRRESLFSARNFDFFDVGIMAGVRHAVDTLEKGQIDLQCQRPDVVTVKPGRILARRSDPTTKSTSILVEWTPENILDDEWIPIEEFGRSREVSLGRLSGEAKTEVATKLFFGGRGRQPSTSNRRKRK